jgi:hypothetical protein
MNRSLGREDRSFAAAIASEKARLDSAPDKQTRFRYSYTDRGWYLKQLEQIEQLAPSSDLLVTLYDDLVDAPARLLGNIWRFLGVSEPVPPPITNERVNGFQTFRSTRVRYMTRGYPRRVRNVIGRLNRRTESYPPMSDAVRVSLEGMFTPANQALSQWVEGTSIPDWMQGDKRTADR